MSLQKKIWKGQPRRQLKRDESTMGKRMPLFPPPIFHFPSHILQTVQIFGISHSLGRKTGGVWLLLLDIWIISTFFSPLFFVAYFFLSFFCRFQPAFVVLEFLPPTQDLIKPKTWFMNERIRCPGRRIWVGLKNVEWKGAVFAIMIWGWQRSKAAAAAAERAVKGGIIPCNI